MKKILLALLLPCSLCIADEVSLVMEDGYQPLIVAPRISFFVTKLYTDGSSFPAGTKALYIVTTDCTKQQQKRVLTEVYYPVTEKIMSTHKDTEEVTNELKEKPYSDIPAELKPITSELCDSMKLT
jgi:hypothetical protein